MGPIKLIFFALRIFLTIGMPCGYCNVIRDMARAAVRANAHDSMSASKFNRMLWSGGRRKTHAHGLKGGEK